MTLNIKLKRSSTKDSAPTAAQLEDGELGINYNKDSLALYAKDSDGSIRKIAGQGSEGSYWNLTSTTLSPTDNTYGVDIGSGKIELKPDGSITADSTINGLTVGRGAGDLDVNTVVGFEALSGSNTGVQNTATGYRALRANTSGTSNTALGGQALVANTEGATNTATGYQTQDNNTTGDGNTGTGYQALRQNESGSNNTAVGLKAGYYIEGSNNTVLGAYVGTAADSTLSDTVIISAGTTERARCDSSGDWSTAGSITMDGDVKIGGTVSSPKIELTASDGSITAAGTVKSTTYGVGSIGFEAAIPENRASDRYFFSGSAYAFGAPQTTFSVATDGSITAAGSVQCGENTGSSTQDKDGTMLTNVGTVDAFQAAATDRKFFRAGKYGVGEVFSVDKDGSITAAGQIDITGQGNLTGYGWAIANNGGLSNKTPAGTKFNVTNDGSITAAKDVNCAAVVGTQSNETYRTFHGRFKESDGSFTSTTQIFADGSATFVGNIENGFDSASNTADGCSLSSSGAVYVQRPNGSTSSLFGGWLGTTRTSTIGSDGTIEAGVDYDNIRLFAGKGDGTSPARFELGARPPAGLTGDAFTINTYPNAGTTRTIACSIGYDGSATFAGTVTAPNITFNLEPENDANYEVSTETYTETEYIEVPVVNNPGTGTADIEDGVSTADLVNERETRTVAREVEKTREVKTYVGPTMDVKDTLLKITAALTGLKTAAESASTCDELKAAINTALADI